MATITQFEDIEAWKTARFMNYLENYPRSYRVRDEGAEYEA